MTINSLPTYCFSSAIPEIIISGVTETVNVTVDFNQEIVLDEPLSPYGGQIKLYDIEELIKPFIEQDNAGYLTITATSEETEVTRSSYVYYAATDVGSDFQTFTQRRFLSLLGLRKLTGYGRTELLHIAGRSSSARAYCYYDDGAAKWKQLQTAGGDSDHESFNVSPSTFTEGEKKVVGYDVDVDGRQMSFIVDQHEHEITAEFRFKNSFGMTEYLYCIGTVESNSSYDRSTVTINKQTVEYDNKETRSFKCDTGFICPEMYDFVEDFFRSKSISVKKNGRWLPVVLAECSTNFRNDDNAITRATFTYTYAGNQNVL